MQYTLISPSTDKTLKLNIEIFGTDYFKLLKFEIILSLILIQGFSQQCQENFGSLKNFSINSS